MAVTNNQIVLPNPQEPHIPLTLININNSIKLSSTNYLSWKLQIESLLIGYDLQKFIDGTHPSPSPTITVNNITSNNPAYLTWLRQDRLLFGALVGTISPNLVPIITQATTSQEAWEMLSNTFAKPPRGHIKQIKDSLKNIIKGSLSISHYIQAIKTKADELAILGKPVDPEDLVEKILDGLDSSYQPVIDAVNGRDTVISIEELLEKLLNRELSLRNASVSLGHPITAHSTQTQRQHYRPNQRTGNNRQPWSSRPQHTHSPVSSQSTYQPRPFLGKCQWCRNQGHVVTQCPIFRQQCPHVTPPPFSGTSTASPTLPPWQAQVHVSTASQPWLLDSGATHHVATDISHLDSHQAYI